MMGDEYLMLREDGYIRMNFPVTSLTYHSNLNIILVKTDTGSVHVLDVNSGVILQSSCLSADYRGTLGVEYASGADRVFLWDNSGIGARTDYNGVLLLHTSLQRPLPSTQAERNIRIELVLSEAVLLYQCVQSLDALSIDGLADFTSQLKQAIDEEPVKKGVKAQKWSTVTLTLPQSTLRLVMIGVVQELKSQNRKIPALAIASAVGQRANELLPCIKDEESRALMYSEAERKETFKRWPHMDYKWALPVRMAQAGFYHQPSPSGDDRAMCFTCMVCLVCWEKSDDPWVEHERHSPNCPFVRGEYTHNVPISVTNATSCAVPCSNVKIVSKGNTGDMIATGTVEGKVNVWKFDCGLKLAKFIHLSPYDSIFSGILTTDCNKVWSASLEKDTSTYGIELTAMTFVGMTSPESNQGQSADSSEKENIPNKTKPSLICAVIITRTTCITSELPIQEDSSKALFDSGEPTMSKENVKAMNDQNEAKNNVPCTNKMLFLLTYDIFSSLAGSITTVVQPSNSSATSKPGGSKKVCTVQRTDDANIYDDIYFQYSDEDTELPQCTNSIIDEQISHVINLNASSSKDNTKNWEPKKIVFTKHLKVIPSPPTALLPELPDSSQVLDFVGKFAQIKSWKSAHLDSVGTKVVVDQTDAAPADPITYTQYFNNATTELTDLTWFETSDVVEKVKSTFGGSKLGTQTAASLANNDGFENDPPQEDAVSQGVAVQCLSLPEDLDLNDDSRVTHLLPTEDKEHVLVIISCIEPDKIKMEDDLDCNFDTKMDVDDVSDNGDKTPVEDSKAYMLLYKVNTKTSVYTLEDHPISIKELFHFESPVDVCLLPANKHNQYLFAVVGLDGRLRLYNLPHFSLVSENIVPKGPFTSVVYCASVERISAATKDGMIYFYAFNNNERDSIGDANEDELSNIDYDMLQRAPRDEGRGSPVAPVIIPNKPNLSSNDLTTLMSLTGFYGLNTTVPYSAVVPGFWCELSPAQRSRSDHQNNRSWRLQSTSSTWDEHVLELTLPYSVSLSHVEFSFTLHSASSVNLPIIQVTLLKQNHHGVGYKKDASFGQRPESPVHFPVKESDANNVENPVNSEEYLQAHNAEILAGPLLLSSGLDLTQQSGKLLLTSPRLYRARGRTFLIHIKTLFDPAKDMSKGSIKSGESSAKKSGFIGCDWLHQISITVWACPHTDVPLERQQRITMLESQSFLQTLCNIAVGTAVIEKKKLALDLINWVISVRLQRIRLSKIDKEKDDLCPMEAQQLECIQMVTNYLEELIKSCILCGTRSVAKKCVKIMLLISESAAQLPRPSMCQFDAALTDVLMTCIPMIGACDSPGALKWLMALYSTRGARSFDPRMLTCGTKVLEQVAKCLRNRDEPYHRLLRARFGFYGLPLERHLFATEVPELGKGSPMTVTYATVVSGDTSTSPTPKQDYQLKDLLNIPMDDCKGTGVATSEVAWWSITSNAAALCAGLGEVLPLHVTCHLTSDGTKLESTTSRVPPPVVSAHPVDANQLWSVVKESHLNQASKDPERTEEVGTVLMECDSQEKADFTDENIFNEEEQCNIPWAALVTKPPQHTLVVERMHSGARRYVVLDFGYTVRLTDLIIPMCSDLVTLCIDIWTVGEETDSVKIAFATDIATKHLVLTDLQPPPLARYMKITTIGRYGMSAMKCKIPLGWFYGEVAEVANVQASTEALGALLQDISCRFRLASGKLIDVLNPYLELYNGNAAHMIAYLHHGNDSDPKVSAAYQECLELQSQLHNCNIILKQLQKLSTRPVKCEEAINWGTVTAESLLERASTDKLRVIAENVIDMLLHFLYNKQGTEEDEEDNVMSGLNISEEWVRIVSELGTDMGVRAAAGTCALLARTAASQPWWGKLLADLLIRHFTVSDAPPCPLDRHLSAVIYMARKSLYANNGEGGVTQALCQSVLQQLQETRTQPALLAVLLTALAAVLDAALESAALRTDSRWDWVTGGRLKSTCSDGSSTPPLRDCRIHRRKLPGKPLHKLPQDMDAWMEVAKRGIQMSIEDEHRERERERLNKSRSCTRIRSTGGAGGAEEGVAIVSAPLAASLSQALVSHILTMDATLHSDQLLIVSKVVGRLCALCGSAAIPDTASVLGLAQLAVRLPTWPCHALTVLLQDLVEYEFGEVVTTPTDDWAGAGSSRTARAGDGEVSFGKTPTKRPNPAVYLMTLGYPLSQVSESDDSANEKIVEYLANTSRLSKSKIVESIGSMSTCVDARLESGAAATGEALARRVLATAAASLPTALRASPLYPRAPQSPDAQPGPISPVSPSSTSPVSPDRPYRMGLSKMFFEIFKHLTHEFASRRQCSYIENVMTLWLTLNGSVWSGSVTGQMPWQAGLPTDPPRVRLSSESVIALMKALVGLEHVTLRCWVVSMQSLAWMANHPLLLENSTQTMGRVILESEYFGPLLVKLVSMDASSDTTIMTADPYLGGACGGAGTAAAAALTALLGRVVKPRAVSGAAKTLRVLSEIWKRPLSSSASLDLHAALLRSAHMVLPSMSAAQPDYALPLFAAIAEQSPSWVQENSGIKMESGTSESRLSGLLADVLTTGGTRRAPQRRALLHQLLQYCRRMLSVPLKPRHMSDPVVTTPDAPVTETSQTDETKAELNAAQMEGTNLEDEKKRHGLKVPCLADCVLQNSALVINLFRSLSYCDGMNTLILNSDGGIPEPSTENWTLKEELYWLVAQIPAVAADPSLMLVSLKEYLRTDEAVFLSQGMQNLIVRLFEKPDVLDKFLDEGGMELVIEKLIVFHQGGPSSKQGLVSSLMNYLKMPPQLINLSSNLKKQPSVIEIANGLVNIAPLCTIQCSNPTAQSADVLLGGGATCAARRVRAASWTYHFYSTDDITLSMTLRLPYSARLHEVHLQPHGATLATCPGAVAVETGFGNSFSPLGPPQHTSGMSFIRLVVTQPVVCGAVIVRLYRPRDSSSMGLLHLRLLVSPAFASNHVPDLNQPEAYSYTNRWARVVWTCTRARPENAVWAANGVAAIRALCACVVGGGPAAHHAHLAILAAARAQPAVRANLLHSVLAMDAHAHSHAFQGRPSVLWHANVTALCALASALCRWCADGCSQAYVNWLSSVAEEWLREKRAPAAALVHTFAEVLWMLKEEQLLDNLEKMITDDLFELVYMWIKDVSENGLLKKALDAVLCSMCYIRPELFKLLLEQMEIPIDMDESMECLTDDTKVKQPERSERPASGADNFATRLHGWQLRSLASASLSPSATHNLLHSSLPSALIRAIADFCQTKLEAILAQEKAQKQNKTEPTSDSESEAPEPVMKTSTSYKGNDDLSALRNVCELIEWTRQVCNDLLIKDWLGSEGSIFWSPLLRLLCHPRPKESSWQEGALYSQLEETTIRLFAELTVCHDANQKLFASTLHTILGSMTNTGPEGISGFTRALILRLVLSGERVTVALRWTSVGVPPTPGSLPNVPPAAPAPPAPRHPAAAYHALLTLPLQTTVRTLLSDHRPQMPVMDETTQMNRSNPPSPARKSMRNPNEVAIMTVAEAWELSLAAASASKEKRLKDVKNSSLKQQNNKKRQTKNNNDISTISFTEDVMETTIRVQVDGIEGYIPASATLAQIMAAAPRDHGPHLSLNLHLNTSGDTWTGAVWEASNINSALERVTAAGTVPSGGSPVLRSFGACGGLALVAARLPRPHAAAQPRPQHQQTHDLDWVKVDDPYEEVIELSAGTGGNSSDDPQPCAGVPTHALLGLALLLKLPGYADAFLDEGTRAVQLLRLLLGVAHDEDGRTIVTAGANSARHSLGTLPFRVVSALLEKAPRGTPEGRSLRRSLVQLGAMRLVLACLAVFTHHRPTQNRESLHGTGKSEEKSQLYWAKGTGYGTGSTQQSWNVEQALVRQRIEEEHVTILLQVMVSYMNPGEKWPPEEGSPEEEAEDKDEDEGEGHDLPLEFIDLVAGSSFVPAICSYLRNDSVLDMSRHIPLYVCVLRCVRALQSLRSRRLANVLHPLPRLLATMSCTTNSYATKLRMSKKNLFGKMTYSQRFSTSSNSELSEEDEGLALLIADIQATSALMCRMEGEAESTGLPLALLSASRETRYIDQMRTMQFETFEMMCANNDGGFRFTVPYHFESAVRAAGVRAHPARMKRLAQEAATLATSLPLSYSSSVFVRTDTDRLDIMKVLITGPSDTPYANGCFILDVYFPTDYPMVPMLINLETTGRHTVRFNPNLYNDGKVCLSVLNTWHGRPEEKWNAHTSSFLQVLVSIQSLILVPEPYFNEPGYERSRGTRVGSSASLEYNSTIYQACVRWAMLDHLRSPEPCFKEVIQTHFWIKRNEIMKTVANWITELEGQRDEGPTQRSIQLNLMALKRHYVKLQEELAKLPVPPGLEDLDEPFQLPAAPQSPPLRDARPAPATRTSDEIDHDMEKIVSHVLD